VFLFWLSFLNVGDLHELTFHVFSFRPKTQLLLKLERRLYSRSNTVILDTFLPQEFYSALPMLRSYVLQLFFIPCVISS
jgi:hypothetical protein